MKFWLKPRPTSGAKPRKRRRPNTNLTSFRQPRRPTGVFVKLKKEVSIHLKCSKKNVCGPHKNERHERTPKRLSRRTKTVKLLGMHKLGGTPKSTLAVLRGSASYR